MKRAWMTAAAGLVLAGCASGPPLTERGQREEAVDRMEGMQTLLREMGKQCHGRKQVDPAVDCSDYEGPLVDERPRALTTP